MTSASLPARRSIVRMGRCRGVACEGTALEQSSRFDASNGRGTMRLRWSSAFVLLLVAGVGFAYLLGQRGRTVEITSKAGWDSLCRSGRSVVFVDGDWNMDIVMFRKTFDKFAAWCGSNPVVKPARLQIDPNDRDNEVWAICQGIWAQYGISLGGLKNFGGAGRVLWVDRGTIVDFAWCQELVDSADRSNVEILVARTRRAFPDL